MSARFHCLVDGRPARQVPLTDRGLQYGHGVFETMAWVDGRLQFWSRHLDRLYKGCARLSIPAPAAELLEHEVDEVTRGHSGKAVVKITITRGDSLQGYLADSHSPARRIVCRLPWRERRHSPGGIKVALCRQTLGYNPLLAGIKHLNRLEQVLARQEWDDAEFGEGLMLDRHRRLVSATMSNVFVVKDRVLLTPDLSAAGVEGVVRGVVMELARELGIALRVAALPLAETAGCAEMFLTNSLTGIVPVSCFDGKEFASPGEVTAALIERLEAVCRQRG